MSKFDRRSHRLVAMRFEDGQPVGGPNDFVVVDDDFLDELRDVARQASSRQEVANVEPLREIVKVQEVLPDDVSDRIAWMEKTVESLQERLRSLESQPKLSKKDINDLTSAFNTRVKSAVEEQVKTYLDSLPDRSAAVVVDQQTTTSATVADQLDALAKLIRSVQTDVTDHQRRIRETANKVIETRAWFLRFLASAHEAPAPSFDDQEVA